VTSTGSFLHVALSPAGAVDLQVTSLSVVQGSVSSNLGSFSSLAGNSDIFPSGAGVNVSLGKLVALSSFQASGSSLQLLLHAQVNNAGGVVSAG